MKILFVLAMLVVPIFPTVTFGQASVVIDYGYPEDVEFYTVEKGDSDYEGPWNDQVRRDAIMKMVGIIFGESAGFKFEPDRPSDFYHLVMPGTRNDYRVDFVTKIQNVLTDVNCHLLIFKYQIELTNCFTRHADGNIDKVILFPYFEKGDFVAVQNGSLRKLVFDTKRLLKSN